VLFTPDEDPGYFDAIKGISIVFSEYGSENNQMS